MLTQKLNLIIVTVTIGFTLFLVSCKNECGDMECENGGTCLHGTCFCDEETECRGETCDECPEIIEFLPEAIDQGLFPEVISGDNYLADSVFQDVSVELKTIGQTIVAKIQVNFQEIGNDTTVATGEWIEPIYTLGPEFELIGIESERLSSCLSIDYSPDVFICSGPANMPVNRFHIMGLPVDSGAPSFGGFTKEYAHVVVVFNPIKLKVYRL